MVTERSRSNISNSTILLANLLHRVSQRLPTYLTAKTQRKKEIGKRRSEKGKGDWRLESGDKIYTVTERSRSSSLLITSSNSYLQ